MHRRLAPWFVLLGSLAVAQTPRVTVEGRIVEVDGTPIAGATIGVPGENSQVSGSDGRFSIELGGERLLAGDDQLVLSARDRVSFRMPVSTMLWNAESSGLLRQHMVALGDVRLPRGVNFRGRVRSADGTALAGVRIRALDELTGHARWQSGFGGVVTSQKDGRFVLSGVFDRAMRITFEADGHYRDVVRAAAIESPLDLRLEPSGFVTGPLPTMDGAPFDGWIRIHSEFLDEEPDCVRVRGERYSIGVSTRGRFRVLGMCKSGEIAWQSDVLDGPKEGVELHELDIGPDAMRLRAVDAATGAPVESVRATVNWWIAEADLRATSALLATLVRTSPAANPRLPPPQFEREAGIVAVSAPGYATLVQPVKFEAGGEVVVRLEPEASIAGTVVDARGEPLASCVVSCNAVDPQSRCPVQLARTGADGKFSFRALRHEKYMLYSEAAPGVATGFARCDVRELDLDDVRLEVPDGLTVSGVISGFDITPGCRVLLFAGTGKDVQRDAPRIGILDLDPWRLDGVLSAPIGADGSFELTGCVSGDARLVLFVPAPPRSGAPMRLPIWAGEIVIGKNRLEIDASPHRLSSLVGKVKAPDAVLAAGRLVVLAREVRANRGFAPAEQQVGLARWRLVGGDGAFELALPPGEHTVEVVDCVTGIPMMQRDARAQVQSRAGAVEKLDIAIDVVEVEVRFVRAGGGRTLVDHLTVGVGQPEGPWSWEMTVFGGGTYGTAGVFVEGRRESATFFAPPGTLKLGFHRVSKLDKGSAQLDQDQGTTTVEIGAGPSQVVELQVPPARELGDAPK